MCARRSALPSVSETSVINDLTPRALIYTSIELVKPIEIARLTSPCGQHALAKHDYMQNSVLKLARVTNLSANGERLVYRGSMVRAVALTQRSHEEPHTYPK